MIQDQIKSNILNVIKNKNYKMIISCNYSLIHGSSIGDQLKILMPSINNLKWSSSKINKINLNNINEVVNKQKMHIQENFEVENDSASISRIIKISV